MTDTGGSTTQRNGQRGAAFYVMVGAEFLAFLPVVFTWWAIGQAVQKSNDRKGYVGTFLEGWRDGFGDPDFFYRLERVAKVDAAIILGVAVVFAAAAAVRGPDRGDGRGRRDSSDAIGAAAAVRAAALVGRAGKEVEAVLGTAAAELRSSAELLREPTITMASTAGDLGGHVARVAGALEHMAEFADQVQRLGDELHGINDTVAASVNEANAQTQAAQEAGQAIVTGLEEVVTAVRAMASAGHQMASGARAVTDTQSYFQRTAAGSNQVIRELSGESLKAVQELRTTLQSLDTRFGSLLDRLDGALPNPAGRPRTSRRRTTREGDGTP